MDLLAKYSSKFVFSWQNCENVISQGEDGKCTPLEFTILISSYVFIFSLKLFVLK